MNTGIPFPERTTRSFVIREGRFTAAQRKNLSELWPHYGIDLGNEPIELNPHFNSTQPIIMDIGFGSGESLVSIAQQRSDINFLGVEVYRPGIGNLFRQLANLEIENVRVVNADVLEFMQTNLKEKSLHGITIWFPDPWPKKRHHKRRLVQGNFIQQATRALNNQSIMHFASDWQNYADQVQEIMRTQTSYKSLAVKQNPLLAMPRPSTRFERRGLRLGHKVTDLYYCLNK